jgi:hypothetical protein
MDPLKGQTATATPAEPGGLFGFARVRLPDDPGRLPDLPYRGFNVTGSRKLEPGASTSYEITREAGPPGVDALMVCGRLEYAGGSTGFCRVWDSTHNHFVAVGGPDYEYEH